MGKYANIENISKRITDPEKIKYLTEMPENVLAIIARSFISPDDQEILAEYPKAQQIREIALLGLIDFNSATQLRWQSTKESFQENPKYIPYSQFGKSEELLSFAKYENPFGGLRDYSQHRYGIEVVGAIPRRPNKVDLLVTHDQFKWFLEPGDYINKTLEVYDCQKYNIPPGVLIGELKKQQNGSSGTDFSYYFTLPPLDDNSNFFEITLPINK